MTVPLDRIPDSLGYLVLAEDGAVINVCTIFGAICHQQNILLKL